MAATVLFLMVLIAITLQIFPLVMPEISMEMESMTSLLAQNMEILMVKVT